MAIAGIAHRRGRLSRCGIGIAILAISIADDRLSGRHQTGVSSSDGDFDLD